jgi:hypothetical protein
VTYHKIFIVGAGFIAPEAEVIAADYQTVAIPDNDKKLLAYVKKVAHHAYKSTDTDVDCRKRRF